MLKLGIVLTLQFWNNPLCQHLAELNTPLVERINIPDRALRKYGVLIQSDQFP